MSSFARQMIAAAAATALVAGSAGAQLLPGLPLPSVNLPVGGLPGNLPVGRLPTGDLPVVGQTVDQLLANPATREALRPTLNSVGGYPQAVVEAGSSTLLDIRRMRLRELIRSNPQSLESNGKGIPVRRNVLVVVDPDPASLGVAIRNGFRLLGDERQGILGFRTVLLAVPAGLNARTGLARLKSVAPRLDADFDHVLEPAGGQLLPFAAALAANQGRSGGPRIGMIDGGVAAHPSLAAAQIEQNGFAGSPQPTGHGTAVASLMVGRQGPFQGAANGAALFVADVYGGNQAAGSASVVTRALAWLASKDPAVINISLVGPHNRLLQRAIQAVRARGIAVVAAVGNDGPAAPPQFPASYPGVVAVTGVDSKGRALPEAGKAAHLDFAAPGADMAAALPGQGYAKVRGTSFAAPLATSRLALRGSIQALASEARPGRGKVGRGIVCGPCRVDPKAVRAK